MQKFNFEHDKIMKFVFSSDTIQAKTLQYFGYESVSTDEFIYRKRIGFYFVYVTLDTERDVENMVFKFYTTQPNSLEYKLEHTDIIYTFAKKVMANSPTKHVDKFVEICLLIAQVEQNASNKLKSYDFPGFLIALTTNLEPDAPNRIPYAITREPRDTDPEIDDDPTSHMSFNDEVNKYIKDNPANTLTVNSPTYSVCNDIKRFTRDEWKNITEPDLAVGPVVTITADKYSKNAPEVHDVFSYNTETKLVTGPIPGFSNNVKFKTLEHLLQLLRVMGYTNIYTMYDYTIIPPKPQELVTINLQF